MAAPTEIERNYNNSRKEFYRQIGIALTAHREMYLSAEQMVEHAAKLWAEIEKTDTTISASAVREKILLDALRFYADRKNWMPGEGTGSNFANDLGSVARTAIQMAGLGF